MSNWSCYLSFRHDILPSLPTRKLTLLIDLEIYRNASSTIWLICTCPAAQIYPSKSKSQFNDASLKRRKLQSHHYDALTLKTGATTFKVTFLC